MPSAVSVIAAFYLLQVFILWLAIPAATGLVFLPAFLLQPVLETCLLNLILGGIIPTFHIRIVLFPSFSKAFHGAPFAPGTLSPLRICQWFFSICPQRIVTTSLA